MLSMAVGCVGGGAALVVVVAVEEAAGPPAPLSVEVGCGWLPCGDSGTKDMSVRFTPFPCDPVVLLAPEVDKCGGTAECGGKLPPTSPPASVSGVYRFNTRRSLLPPPPSALCALEALEWGVVWGW